MYPRGYIFLSQKMYPRAPTHTRVSLSNADASAGVSGGGGREVFEMKYGVCGRNCASQFSSPYTPQHQLPIGGAATRPSFLAPIG